MSLKRFYIMENPYQLGSGEPPDHGSVCWSRTVNVYAYTDLWMLFFELRTRVSNSTMLREWIRQICHEHKFGARALVEVLDNYTPQMLNDPHEREHIYWFLKEIAEVPDPAAWFYWFRSPDRCWDEMPRKKKSLKSA